MKWRPFVSGFIAEALGFERAIRVVAALALVAGGVVALRMYETRPRGAPAFAAAS